MLDTTAPSDPFSQDLQRISHLIGAGQLPVAAQALNAAQRHAPQDARVFLLGMRLAQRAGNLNGAIQSARRALALAPGWPVAMLELGLLLARGAEKEQALRLARDAAALEPDDPRVLMNAARIAYVVGDREQALPWLQRGVDLQPDDAPSRLALAQTLVELGRHAEAKPHFDRLEQRFSGDIHVLLGQLGCALATQDAEAARRYADRALAVQPDDQNVRYWHAVAHGQTPSTQPPTVIADLFDDYAQRFDMHLVRGLQYRVPERVAQILLGLHPDRRFNLLDLGCGTGLIGVYLGRLNGHIVGADLSEKMIEQAAQHQIYSKFHRVNILDALRDTPAEHYEAITCTDVLIYVGDLTPVIPNAYRILKPGGHFIFSCETAGEDEPDLALRDKSKRYAHKASAVERQCREAGFDEVTIEHLPTLRMENSQPLPGFLVTAHKPL